MTPAGPRRLAQKTITTMRNDLVKSLLRKGAFALAMLASNGLAAEPVQTTHPTVQATNWIRSSVLPSDNKFLRMLQAPNNLTAECCKVCTKGKPCGDTCISQDKTCHLTKADIDAGRPRTG